MNLCGEHGRYEDIAYEGRTCPACVQVIALQQHVEDLKEQLDNLRDELGLSQES